MDHTAAPFVPRGKSAHHASSAHPPQPLTPPLAGQAHPGLNSPGAMHGNYPPYSGPHYHHHHHHHHHSQHPQQYQQPPAGARGYPGQGVPPGFSPTRAPPGPAHFDAVTRPPAYAPASVKSKLRAGASEYVPGMPRKSATATPEGPKSPAKSKEFPAVPSDEKHAAPPPSYQEATQSNPTSPVTASELTRLSATAQPYTPTRRLAGGFPNVPAPGSATSENGSATGNAQPPLKEMNAGALKSPETGTTDETPVNDSPQPESPTSPLSPVYAGSADTFRTSKLVVPPTPKPAAEVKLNTTWTLYADSHPINIGSSGHSFNHHANTGDFNPIQLRTIGDMEGFWRVWRSVKPPSCQVPSFTFYFFRRTISPTWEDPRNRNGGTVTIPIWDRDRMTLHDRLVMDDVWWLTTMALAGDSLPNAMLLNGASLKIRQRSIMLQLWTNSVDQAKLTEMANGLRALLCETLGPNRPLDGLEFFAHSSADQTKPQSPLTSKPPSKMARGAAAAKVQKREADFKL
jgi:hypothetical protein